MKHRNFGYGKADSISFRNIRSHAFRLILVLLLIVSVSAMLTGCRRKEPPIKIGVIISQSGPGGHLSATLDAIHLAVDEINEAGGIQNRKIEVYSTDNETNIELAIKQFKEMEKDVSPDIYISALSTISTQLIPLAEEAGVPILCIVTAMENLTKDKEWAFRLYSMATNEVEPIMTSLRTYNIKNLGILHSDDEYGLSVYTLLSEAAQKEGIAVTDESFQNGVTDLTDQVNALSGNDGIYVVGLVSAVPVAVAAFTETGYQGYRLSSSAACSPVTLALDDADGMIVAAPVIYNPNFSLAEKLTENYMEVYGEKPTQQVATGYESIRILAGLLQEGEISRETIREKLASGFVYTGSLGNISIQRGEHDFTFPLYPAHIEEGAVIYE